jgi:tellurite resistance protein TerC
VQYKQRVLFWGIIGALFLRGILIAAGVTLVSQFHWMLYLFGAFLVFTGGKLLFTEVDDIDPATNPVMRMVRKFYPVSEHYDGTKFITVEKGKRAVTPLFLIILMVGTTDVIFALDSIPAIFAITLDPFIVFTANVFAVLGLRSLYFLLAGMVSKFHYLKYGLSAVLIFVGVKMLVAHYYLIPTGLSLLIVATLLFIAVSASMIRDRRIRRRKS